VSFFAAAPLRSEVATGALGLTPYSGCQLLRFNTLTAQKHPERAYKAIQNAQLVYDEHKIISKIHYSESMSNSSHGKINPTETQKLGIIPCNNPPCYDVETNIPILAVLSDDGGTYLLPYKQLFYAELTPGPSRSPIALLEKLQIHFSMADLTVLGKGLKPIELAVQKGELKLVKPVDKRFSQNMSTHVASVKIEFLKPLS